MAELDLFLRILAAAILGGSIGLERELHGCAAGLRTHILVCIGSALFMVTSIGMAQEYASLGAVDPSRIAAGVVTGIGFLGAGAIIRYGTSIRGLTTAASIWAVSAVGLAVGAGMYIPGVITTLIALVVLILSRLEEVMELKRQSRKIIVKLSPEADTSSEDIKSIIESYGGRTKRIAPLKETDAEFLEFHVMLPRLCRKDTIMEIQCLPGVLEASWG
ncbi:MAG: MgtC/SapB family protein [Candidatus Omnitrophota bacterium]